MKRLLSIVSLAFVLVVCNASQSSAQGLLPQGFGDWTAAQPTQTSAAQTSPFGPGILDEYGFLSREEKTYAHGAERLDVTLYRMADPTAAYGAFTYLQTPEMHSLGVTKYSAGLNDRAIIVVGNFLLDVNGPRAAARSDEFKLLVGALQPKADRRPFPEIEEHLP
ncbi:MAG TPA: DUF6599 family protein, partial [Candidatus Acidoferrales bacterium]|nr:DUF6599 family protein [Candidatus Acidoferrales bacterium]